MVLFIKYFKRIHPFKHLYGIIGAPNIMNVYILTEYTKIHKENTWIYIQLVENIE